MTMYSGLFDIKKMTAFFFFFFFLLFFLKLDFHKLHTHTHTPRTGKKKKTEWGHGGGSPKFFHKRKKVSTPFSPPFFSNF